MHLTHFVLTRFSYTEPRTHAHGRVKSNVTTLDAQAAHRLRKRFTLFELFCLPSLLSQTSRDFTWVLLIDRKMKRQYRERLRELTRGHRETHLVEVTSVAALPGLQWLQPYVTEPATTHIATTNVDDDDMIGPRVLEYAQRYIRRRAARDELPPCTIIGHASPLCWDFMPTREAPLGYVKPWTGRDYPMFTGYTVCSKQPAYDFSALAFNHSQGAAYFDPSRDLRDATQARLRAAAERAGDDWRVWRPAQHLHVAPATTPQIVVVNHLENDDIVRLFQNWSTRRPVVGAMDFPGFLVPWHKIPSAIRLFRRSPAAVMRHMYRGMRLAMSPVRTHVTRARVLYLALMAPRWFMTGLPEVTRARREPIIRSNRTRKF